jgi:hypothetical protein
MAGGKERDRKKREGRDRCTKRKDEIRRKKMLVVCRVPSGIAIINIVLDPTPQVSIMKSCFKNP